MRRVNKPFDLAKDVQAAVDLRADLSSFQIKILRDGEMAQWLRMSTTLVENLGSVPSTHPGWLTTAGSSSSRRIPWTLRYTQASSTLRHTRNWK